jgi:RNA polymerase sigma-70 factor, ECF subfamily
MANQGASPPATSVAAEPKEVDRKQSARMAAMLDEHFVSVWRFLRRLGVPPADVDDYAQEVMLIAARKIAQIERGKERGFLFGVAHRVASDARRAHAHRGETDDELLDQREDPSPGPEILVDHHRARTVLDQVLAAMPLDLRAVFVLTEIDELPMAQIADLLQLPMGTVASRLRRAREHFDARVKRIHAGLAHGAGAS